MSLAILCRLNNMKRYIACTRYRFCESSNDCFNVSYVNIQVKSSHRWNIVDKLLNALLSGHLALHGNMHTYTHNTHLCVVASVLGALVTCTVASHHINNNKNKLLQKSRYDHCQNGIRKTFLTTL